MIKWMHKLSAWDILTFVVSPTRFIIERFENRDERTIRIWNWIFRCALIACVVGLYGVKTGEAVLHIALGFGYIGLWFFPFSRITELGIAFYRDAFQRFGPTTATTITPVQRLQFLVLSYFEVAIQFGILYFCLPSGYFTREFSSIIEAIYFSVVTITTAGYGDIAPKKPWSQIGCMCELAVGFILVIFALGSYLATTPRPDERH